VRRCRAIYDGDRRAEKPVTVRLRVFADAHTAARTLARKIARDVRRDPRLVLGLPTGRTSIPLYGELVALHRRGAIDFSAVTTFNLDEFVALGAVDPASYRTFMERRLFRHVNLDPRRVHFLDGRAQDLDAECRRYERAIERAGGIDLLLLGLGANGHIGFNEPADALVASTHRTRLTRATRQANAGLFGGLSRVPHEALSMGMATILRAKEIVLLATGATKARCVARMIGGPVTPRLPASFLQLHALAEVWVDRAAGRLAGVGSARAKRPLQ
jgi:glucosamine-6-phosphate deaminase